MRFYRATQFIFPRHYEWRILLLCFVAVHIPLISAITYQAVTGTWQLASLLVLLVATLAGTVFGVAAIHGLLRPVKQATTMLRAVQMGEPIADLPEPGADVVGDLFRGVAAASLGTREKIADLETLSEYDPLTAIRNRRGFTNAAAKALTGEKNAVLALIDLDHFKLVNDRFGHDAGDTLLRNIARTLESDLRRSDICCRWGGEEFAILFPDTLLDEARIVMERLRASIALDSHLLDESWPITLSCGIAPLRTLEDLTEAARRADVALFEAKNSGRNRVRVARD